MRSMGRAWPAVCLLAVSSPGHVRWTGEGAVAVQPVGEPSRGLPARIELPPPPPPPRKQAAAGTLPGPAGADCDPELSALPAADHDRRAAGHPGGREADHAPPPHRRYSAVAQSLSRPSAGPRLTGRAGDELGREGQGPGGRVRLRMLAIPSRGRRRSPAP